MDISELLNTDNSEQVEAGNILVSVFCSMAGAENMRGDGVSSVSAREGALRVMVGGFIDRDGVIDHPFYHQKIVDLDNKTPLELTRESQEGLKRVVTHVLRHYQL